MRQKLGQHFLANKEILQKIAGALSMKAGGTIVEIGPGHGELTDIILAEAKDVHLIAIEKDRALAEALREKYKDKKNIEIVEGDARDELLAISSRLKARYKLAGNIPYYLTGYLFRLLGELEQRPEKIVFTIQKEVALRITAKPPHMNLLAASIQIWANPEIVSFIPRDDFNPPPEVESAILKLTAQKSQLAPKNTENYYRAIKIIFKQPRKTILNNISSGFGLPKEECARILSTLVVSGDIRPAQLGIEELKKLTEALSK